jgi:two-component system LytT family response regulator
MKASIIEDERLARNELRRMLQAFPEIEIVGEAQSVEEALSAVERLHPGLLFLDVQIPGGDGFEVLERLEASLASSLRPPTPSTISKGDWIQRRSFEPTAGK